MGDRRSLVAVPRRQGAGGGARSAGAPNGWTAVEQERRRWARELHDETLQNLAGLLIHLSSARRGDRQDVLAASVDETIAGLQQEIVNLRSLITDLRPAALDELGIEAALAALARRAGRNGLAVELTVELADGRARRFELDTAVYRIVQEALTNAHKHGGASRVTVEVRERRRRIELRVRDNGAGFDPSASGAGVGLLGMRERVEEFGGTLRIDSAPGRGVAILAALPADDARPGAAALPADRAA
jgi:two-component system, NarL family, sensor histidine kinase DevS